MNLVYQAPVEVSKKYPSGGNVTYQSVLETVRNVSQYLHVTGTIGGNRVDTYVTSYKRFASLCNPGQRVTLNLDTGFSGTVNPGMAVVIYEKGVKVLTGYVVKSHRSRPSYEWAIDIEDAYTRVSNYFISEGMEFDTTQSARYLIAQILDPTGITYELPPDDAAIPPGTVLGLRSANDALNDILVYGSWYSWVDTDGVLQIKKHTNSPPVVVREPITVEHDRNTEQTRNVIRVYGRQMEDGSMVNVYLKKNVPGLLVDQTSVVASPLISNYDDAERVANYLIQELGSQTNIINFEVTGDPAIQIGTSGSLYYEDPATHAVTSGSGPITSLEVSVNQDGYIMNVTLGERCPRIAGWSIDPREMRALWIACRGGAGDPRPEKLIYTEDFGVGGQPTYNIVKTIPSGLIIGMHVLLNGRRVYLVMGRKETRDGVTRQLCELWYSDNPYSNDVTWTKLLYSGLPTGGGGRIDDGYFGYNAIMSAHVIKNTLYLGVRRSFGTYQQFTRGTITDQSTEFVQDGEAENVPNGLNTAISCGNTRFREETLAYIRGKSIGSTSPYLIYSPNRQTFGMTLRNGVGFGVDGPGGMWSTQTIDAFSPGITTTVAPVYANEYHDLVKGRFMPGPQGSETVLVPRPLGNVEGDFPTARTFVRGYYWGTQIQTVDKNGNLYIGTDMDMHKVFRWDTSLGGIVECISKSKPNYLAWFPRVSNQNNEMARWSLDNGTSWRNMTGNWWGTNSEVLAGTKMQSQGGFSLFDAHPTFWSSEIDS